MIQKKYSCVICGKKSTEVIKQIGNNKIAICKNDGLVFQNPRLSKTEYDQINKLYKDKSGRFDQQVDVWNKLKEHSEIPQKPNILDIGTGYTHLPAFLEKNIIEFTYYGIEMNSEYITELENMGVAIIDTDVDSDAWAVEGKNMFDIVIIRQILDHFTDPLDVLKKVWAVLKPKGVVFISVTDIMKDKREKLFIGNHIHYFSKATLNRLTEMARLKLVADGYNNDVEYWGIYTKGRATKSKFTSVYEEQKNFLTAEEPKEEPKKDEDAEPKS
jgi:2-polyprenyl-3-methyl-5-hydroxy-6-metoxy-1,4-benzoquinol methylase